MCAKKENRVTNLSSKIVEVHIADFEMNDSIIYSIWLYCGSVGGSLHVLS